MTDRAWWRRSKKKPDDIPAVDLREFVYLDETSLRSLLASLVGEVTSEVVQALSRAEAAELAGGISAGALGLKSEVRSRFETSNSRSTQTTRKASVQSLFAEFHREVVKHGLLKLAAGEAELGSVAVADLHRGDLVELDVKLGVDPIFSFATLVGELCAIAQEAPNLIGDGGQGVVSEFAEINALLERLLVGLIPIQATSTSHTVALDATGVATIQRAVPADGAGAETPLRIVGITEHLGYWKDIRRVLFSQAEVRVLCRVARPKLSDGWSPVTLAGIFDSFNFGKSESFSEMLGEALDSLQSPEPPSAASHEYLREFARLAAASRDGTLSPELEGFIASLPDAGKDFAAQVDALKAVQARLEDQGVALSSEDGLRLRSEALESLSGDGPVASSLQPRARYGDAGGALDVEIIAIYW